MIRQAMQAPDDLVIEFEYQSASGEKTRRVASPIRLVAQKRFLALCLCREEPRHFVIEKCRNMKLKPAHDYLMPVDIESVGDAVRGDHE